MDGYWKDFPNQAILDAIRKDWMDNLQDWHTDQIKAALVEWRNANPSKKPNPGHILKILKSRRGHAYAKGASSDPLFAVDRPVVDEIGADERRLLEARP